SATSSRSSLEPRYLAGTNDEPATSHSRHYPTSFDISRQRARCLLCTCHRKPISQITGRVFGPDCRQQRAADGKRRRSVMRRRMFIAVGGTLALILGVLILSET